MAAVSTPSDQPKHGGDLTIEVDRNQNLLKVVGRGFWPLPYLVDHLRQFEGALAEARRSLKPSRTLVDLRDAPVQSPDVAAYPHDAISRMYRPPERAAIVVGSSLVKMQMKRGFDPQIHAVFLTLREADDWLRQTD